MRSKSLVLSAATGTVAVLLLLCINFFERPSRIPPDFQFQSHFSRKQAETFYAKARHELLQSYWTDMRHDLQNLRFRYAWNLLRKGEGRIAGVVTNSNADVMACIQFKNGDSFWMTVEPAVYRGLAKRQ